MAVTVKNCLNINPAVDLADDTDFLVIDHLFSPGSVLSLQVPESTGAEMLSSMGYLWPFYFLAVTRLLESHIFSADLEEFIFA